MGLQLHIIDKGEEIVDVCICMYLKSAKGLSSIDQWNVLLNQLHRLTTNWWMGGIPPSELALDFDHWWKDGHPQLEPSSCSVV